MSKQEELLSTYDKHHRKKLYDGWREKLLKKEERELKADESICWSCKNCYGRCSWSYSRYPVKGWKAKRCYSKRMMPGSGTHTVTVLSYHVKSCPYFEQDNRDAINPIYFMSACNDIIDAIVQTAVDDYRKPKKYTSCFGKYANKDSAEEFLSSDWGEYLTNGASKEILRRLKEEEKARLAKREQRVTHHTGKIIYRHHCKDGEYGE